MSKEPLDIERVIMLTRYELSLSQGAAGRETPAHVMDYEKRIKDLLEAVSTLLEANKAMGEKIDALTDELTAMQAKNALLESQVVKLTGELAQHKRSRFGKRSEKSPDKLAHSKDNTKDESEDGYINNGNTPVNLSKEESGTTKT